MGFSRRVSESELACISGWLRRKEPIQEYTLDPVVKTRAGEPLEEIAKRLGPLLVFEDIRRSIGVEPAGYEQADESSGSPGFSEYEMDRARTLAEYRALRAAMDPRLRYFREEIFLQVDRSGVETLIEAPNRWREITGLGKEDRLEGSDVSLGVFQEMLALELGDYWTSDEIENFFFADYVSAREPLLETFSDEDSSSPGTITLQIEPWLPAETVLRHYNYHQRRIFGRIPRAPSADNLAIAAFLFRQLRGAWYKQMRDLRQDGTDGTSQWYSLILSKGFPLLERADLTKGPTWRTLLSLWNESTPHDRFGSTKSYDDVRQFRQDFYRAARMVVYPYLKSTHGSINVGFAETGQE